MSAALIEPHDGGEEFAVLLPHTDGKNAFLAGERLRRKVESQRYYRDGASVKVTVSIGISTVSGPDVASDDFTARADEALYAAKRRGRNRVVLGGLELKT